jgi:hypothetical protein
MPIRYVTIVYIPTLLLYNLTKIDIHICSLKKCSSVFDNYIYRFTLCTYFAVCTCRLYLGSGVKLRKDRDIESRGGVAQKDAFVPGDQMRV